MDMLEGTVPGMRVAGVISDVSVEVVAHRRRYRLTRRDTEQ